MINIQVEQVVSLTDATKLMPKRRGGKRPHVATMHRWSTRGHRGIVLETLQVGGTKCTSVEALQRFFDRLSSPTTSTLPFLTVHRAKQQLAIDRQLDAEGL